MTCPRSLSIGWSQDLGPDLFDQDPCTGWTSNGSLRGPCFPGHIAGHLIFSPPSGGRGRMRFKRPNGWSSLMVLVA